MTPRLKLPEVGEVVLIGLSDPFWGESVHAPIVPAGGATIERQRVIRDCRGSLASFKKPKAVEIVEDLRKSAHGEVLRRKQRDRFVMGVR